ncbi:hypothetical protein J4457_06735 [Candidatus Woesearchaeota archaeon]|nr:hypothetical protein [Candidatus Woesearchaeota archaeon]
MGLSNKKEEQLRKMPYIEAKVFRSKDGRFLIHRTTITDIKATAYYEKVLSSEPSAGQDELVEVTEEMLTA